MADARMDPATFFAWQPHQGESFELVEGRPIPRNRMMTGASTQHDRVVVNLLGGLYNPVRACGCRPTTKAVAIRTGPATIRRPDVTVDCGEPIDDSHGARDPRLVVEVASSSTTAVDGTVKLEEYKRHPTLRYILLLETVAPVALLYRREAEGWQPELFEGLEAVIDLPDIGARLALADVYDDLSFPPRITDAMR